jgi:hypothetical protein
VTRSTTSRCLAYALALPLLEVGWLAAHSLAYRVALPDDQERLNLLHRTGHGYLAYSNVFLALCLTVALVGFAISVVFGMERRGHATAPVLVLASIPPFGFVIQEHLERLLAGGTLPFGTVLEPTFAIGLLLQLPFAALGALLARVLLASGEAIGRLLASRRRPRFLHPEPAREWGLSFSPAPSSIIALAYNERGPPRNLRLG